MTVAGTTPHGLPYIGDDSQPADIPRAMQVFAEAVTSSLGSAGGGVAFATIHGTYSFDNSPTPEGVTGTAVSPNGLAYIPIPTLRAGGVYGAIITPDTWPFLTRIVGGLGGSPVASPAQLSVIGYATDIPSDGTGPSGNQTRSNRQFFVRGNLALNVFAWGIPLNP